MLKPLPQLLMEAQAETLRPGIYECWACGEDFKFHEISVEPLRHPGTGEVEPVEICQRCKDLGVLEKWA